MGILEMAISQSDLESPKVQPLCQAGLCASQFFPEQSFALLQKAILGDPKGELLDFQHGVQLSPASAYRWADLAEAEWNVRDTRQAQYCISQAIRNAPKSSVILTRAANLYFEMGDSEMSAKQLAKILRDPGLTESYDMVFLTYSRLGVPVDELLQKYLPHQREVLSSFLSFLARTHKLEQALATWKFVSARGLADDESVGRFFRFLVDSGHQEEGQQLWADYVKKQQPTYGNTELIFNPGFESNLSASPFSWNVEPRRDVDVVRVQDVRYDGNWSLRIRFNGDTNTAYHQTYQLLVPRAGKYQFSAMIKADQITSDEGVRVHIFDPPGQSRLNVWSDTVTGTKDWVDVSKSFDVPEGVKLLSVELARMESRMFDNKIGGTTWVDHLELYRR